MPQIVVKVAGRGFPLGHQPQWEMRLEVTYQTAARTDVVKIPSDGWQKLVSDEWEIVPTQFCGGSVTAFCRTTLDGEELIGRSFNNFSIWGRNPTKASVRAEFGLLSFQVVGYLESHFTQFGKASVRAEFGLLSPLSIDARREEPAPALVRGSRHGIGGLAEPVLPKHLWNWRENIKETTNRLAQHRANAQAYQTQVQQGQPWDERTGGQPPGQGVAYPDAPPFSDDQLDLEMWSRYASGLRYHDYLPDNKIWLRRADLDADGRASLGYAESCEFVRDSVRDELYPSGWQDENTIPTTRSSVPVAAIKELRKDARAGEALDYLLAAGWTAHLADLTVLHPFRADLGERELLIDNLPVSDEQRATWLVGAIRLAFRSSKELRLQSELAAAFQIFIRMIKVVPIVKTTIRPN